MSGECIFKFFTTAAFSGHAAVFVFEIFQIAFMNCPILK